MPASSGKNELHFIFKQKLKFNQLKAQSTSFRSHLTFRKYIVSNFLLFSNVAPDLQIFPTATVIWSRIIKCWAWHECSNVRIRCAFSVHLSLVWPPNCQLPWKFFHLMITFNKKDLIILALPSKESWPCSCWCARRLRYSLSSLNKGWKVSVTHENIKIKRKVVSKVTSRLRLT